MRTPSEKSIRDAIVKYLKRRGCWVVVTTGVGRAGIPDLLVCYDGAFFAFEVKKPVGGKLSRLQKIEIERIQKAGGEAHVVTSVEDVKVVFMKAGFAT